jgi:hypothetical protein
MEAFESFVAVALEAEGFVVSAAVKFRVQMRTRKKTYMEMQTHGYEVDLVAARADGLVLATIKSFFGSRGVVAEHVTGKTTNERARKLYLLLNNPTIRDQVISEAASRYGYRRARRSNCVSTSVGSQRQPRGRMSSASASGPTTSARAPGRSRCLGSTRS